MPSAPSERPLMACDARARSGSFAGTLVGPEQQCKALENIAHSPPPQDPDTGAEPRPIDQVERQPDGSLGFTRPDGRLLPDVLPSLAVPSDPAQAIRTNEAAGLGLHARTARPGWRGERLDVGWAIDVLHPRAIGE